ncbi:hypothetical protein [Streptomyces sp. YIM S03343]
MSDHEARRGFAGQDWFVRAHVRIRGSHRSASVDPSVLRIFHPGEELEMMQWGQSGQQPDTCAWWTDKDLDAAHSVPGQEVEILEVLEGQLPVTYL